MVSAQIECIFPWKPFVGYVTRLSVFARRGTVFWIMFPSTRVQLRSSHSTRRSRLAQGMWGWIGQAGKTAGEQALKRLTWGGPVKLFLQAEPPRHTHTRAHEFHTSMHRNHRHACMHACIRTYLPAYMCMCIYIDTRHGDIHPMHIKVCI